MMFITLEEPRAPGDDNWDRAGDLPPQPFDLWTRTNLGENLPYPITPLTATAFPALFGLGSEPGQKTQVARRFYGRLYVNEGAIVHNLCEEYGLPSGLLDAMWGSKRRGLHTEPQPFRPLRLLSQLPGLLRGVLRQARQPGGDREPEALFSSIAAWVAEFNGCDLARLDDRTLFARGWQDWQARGKAVYGSNMRIALGSAVSFGMLERLVQWWTRRGKDAHDLVSGLAGVYSAEVGPLLTGMAAALEETGQAGVVRSETPAGALARLRADPTARPVIAQLEAFLARHGHRCPNEVEFRNPRWAEKPEQIIALMGAYAASGSRSAGSSAGDGSLETTEAAARRRQAETQALIEHRLDPLRRAVFRAALRRAQQAMRLRDNSRYYVTLFFFPVRKTFAELGRRWAERGWLGQADDIFFLTLTEIERVVESGTPASPATDMRQTTAERRMAYEYWYGVPAPDVIGHDRKPVAQVLPQRNYLEGVPASPGRASGRARLVLRPEEAIRLQRGDVLVTRATDPGWTPVFPLVSGLVLEVGGQLSHGAIVAREYGIPAVLNVSGAMNSIREGQIVTVDGTSGRVYLEE